MLLVVLFTALRNLSNVRDSTQSLFPRKKFFFCFFKNVHCIVVVFFFFPFCGLEKSSHCLKLFRTSSQRGVPIPAKSLKYEEIGMWFPVYGAANEGYTTVHTVLSVVSNLTALASVGFMFVSYIGFSNDACPFVFSCPA